MLAKVTLQLSKFDRSEYAASVQNYSTDSIDIDAELSSTNGNANGNGNDNTRMKMIRNKMHNYVYGFDEYSMMSTTAQTTGSRNRTFSMNSVHGLKLILQDMEFLSAFMRHLMSEYSSENLLCAAELTQFGEMYGESGLDSAALHQPESDANAILKFDNERFPKSSIVYNKELSIENKAVALIEKYILEGAEFEVNISYECRQRLLVVRDKALGVVDKSEEDAHSFDCRLFDNCLLELRTNLMDSYLRFRYTEGYYRTMDARRSTIASIEKETEAELLSSSSAGVSKSPKLTLASIGSKSRDDADSDHDDDDDDNNLKVDGLPMPIGPPKSPKSLVDMFKSPTLSPTT